MSFMARILEQHAARRCDCRRPVAPDAPGIAMAQKLSNRIKADRNEQESCEHFSCCCRYGNAAQAAGTTGSGLLAQPCPFLSAPIRV